MAGGYVEPRHPPLLRSLTGAPPDNSRFYGEQAARWYDVEYAPKDEDIPFYIEEAGRWAGEGGSVLELAAGGGRVALPMARAGFRVTALDVATPMLDRLRRRLATEPPLVRGRVEIVEQDMRRFALDRLFRFIYLPFNTLLVLAEPEERQAMLNAVRAHLAPSGAFAFDIFTPDPEILALDRTQWRVEFEHDAVDAEVGEQVHVVREMRMRPDYGRQLNRVEFRHTITRGGEPLAGWEDELLLAYIFPRELELILEREGFRVEARYGGPDRRPYNPGPGNIQQAYVVARPAP